MGIVRPESSHAGNTPPRTGPSRPCLQEFLDYVETALDVGYRVKMSEDVHISFRHDLRVMLHVMDTYRSILGGIIDLG